MTMMVISDIHRLPRFPSIMAYCTEENMCEGSKTVTQLREFRGYGNYNRTICRRDVMVKKAWKAIKCIFFERYTKLPRQIRKSAALCRRL